MPYIAVNVTGTLTREQKLAIKSGLGEKISIIPGKIEKALMVDISENHTMFMGGEERPLAFVDVRCYGETELQYKTEFTEAVFEILQSATELTARDIYLNHTDFANWGTRGTLK